MTISRFFRRPALRRATVSTPSSAMALIERVEDRILMSTYTVANLLDHGAGSLRQAVLNANAHPGADIINFASSVKGQIVLTTGQIVITGGLNIVGPGATRVGVSGDNLSRIFDITASSKNPVIISNLTLTRANPGKDTGGGAINNAGTLTASGVVFSNNVAASNTTSESLTHPTAFGGAGIMNYGSATVTNCTFTRNTVYAWKIDWLDGGGGIYNAGTMTVTHSSFYGNNSYESPYAPQNGPNTEPFPWGAAIFDNGTLKLTDSTLDGNYSEAGGALTVGPYGVATVINDTITKNKGDYAGGIELGDMYNSAGAVVHEGKLNIGNTIVAGNIVLLTPDAIDVGNLFSSSINSLGHNLIGATAEAVWKPSDLKGTIASPLNPKLSALAYNGGPTRTAALLAGSPAINAGSNSIAGLYSLTTDQRGFARVVGGVVDIGAYES